MSMGAAEEARGEVQTRISGGMDGWGTSLAMLMTARFLIDAMAFSFPLTSSLPSLLTSRLSRLVCILHPV